MTSDPVPVDDRSPLDVAVLVHTHWDREWYHPVGRFRQRLVALVDQLLDAAPDDDAPPYFLLDGQTIALDDYLAVRPERRGELAAALGSGRLEAGPWCVLADALIPGAESLVQNLLAGRRALRTLGATPPPVLYCPDAFGHPAALPTLATGFGCAAIVAWRGYGGARWPNGDAAWWEAPDGARALLYHLPPDGYEFGSSLPADDAGAATRWAGMRAVLAPRASLGLALVPNGADHHAVQSEWGRAVRALARTASPDRVRVVSLAGFAADLAHRVAARDALPTISGELRDSYGYTWALQGTFASRARQKRRVAQVERMLVRDVAPWLALARLRERVARAGAGCGESDSGDRGRRSLLYAAWRPLLECLPHDTLCGCSTDAVARAMDARLDDAQAQAAGLRADAIDLLLDHDADRARVGRQGWLPSVVVRNRAARARSGVARLTLDLLRRDVAVGPGSAGRWAPIGGRGAVPQVDGGAIPVQILGRTLTHDRIEAPRHYPDVDLVERVEAVAWTGPVPAYGIAAHALDERTGTESITAAGSADPERPVTVQGTTLSNDRLTVTVDADGRVRLGVPAFGLDVASLLAFEDVGDVGDLYTHSRLGAPITAARCEGVTVVHRGPLLGELLVRYRIRVPRAAPADPDDPFSRPRRRASRPVDLPIEVRLTLVADASFLRIGVRGENSARDHRLRVRVSLGIRTPRVLADAAFGPVARVPLAVLAADQRAERVPPTAPLHRYVTLSGDRVGVTLISDGLAEYEASADGDVYLTLVRAVGELSRPDLPERPGHAGWPTPTPEAQSLGAFEAELALAVHGPDSSATRDTVEQMVDDVLLPLEGTTHRALLKRPNAIDGFALDGLGLAVSAITLGEDADIVTLRCVNRTDVAVAGRWTIGAPLAAATLARLDETPLAPLGVEIVDGASRIDFHAGPRAVVTIVVRAAPGESA